MADAEWKECYDTAQSKAIAQLRELVAGESDVRKVDKIVHDLAEQCFIAGRCQQNDEIKHTLGLR